jgi:S1-C subfamily serine protease/predicted esterase
MTRHPAIARLALSLTLLGFAVLSLSAQPPAGEDLAGLQEKAMQAAVQKVAPSVVQIETSGGTDLIGSGPRGPQIRKGAGPTTGLIVAADGYVISSAYNFANKPTAIFVEVPGHKEHYPAKVVATDTTRMVTLLKIDLSGLPVPAAAPRKEIKVGQTVLALGRTWSGAEQPPSVSMGIVSALNRIWGKAIQTDAKVSPVNYGGPLVDIQGRVMGVLVPASPTSQDETAGVEWYDSGIGFAIPFEDINKVLPKLKEGKDLHRGMLGIQPKAQAEPNSPIPSMGGGMPDIYGAAPVIGTVVPQSAAAVAGIQSGDTITEIDGVTVTRYAQVQHLLGPKYEGDVVAVKVKRGDKELAFSQVKLTGLLPALAVPFLGILPMRDDPELGCEVRYVYPKSPADAAGIKAGDRILTLGQGKTPPQFSGRDEALALLGALLPGSEVKVEVRRPGEDKVLSLTLKLGQMPDTVPDELPEPASRGKALEPRKTVDKKPTEPKPAKKDDKKDEKKEDKKDAKKMAETGLLKRTNAARDHEYWVFVPDNYDPNIAHALVVWLHGPARGKEREKDADNMVDLWETFCEDHHIIMVGPKAQNDTGWLASESDFVREAIHTVLGEYTIDRQRIVAHGFASGGQMAYRLGFHDREVIRGVAAVAAALPLDPRENQSSQRLSFFIVTGDKDPLAKAVEDGKNRLQLRKYPVIFRKMANLGHQYPDTATLKELVRWINSLDRM